LYSEALNQALIPRSIMPIIKSAKKRVRVAKKNAIRNNKTKRNVKTAVRALGAALQSKKTTSQKELSQAQSAIDTAVKKGIISKNKAARKKSQLAKQAKAAGHKITKQPAKKATTKAVPKKPAAKKPVKKAAK